MSTVVRKYNIWALLTSTIVAFFLDYLFQGTHYQVYFLPIIITAITLPFWWTIIVSSGIGLVSVILFHGPNFHSGPVVSLALMRILFFNLTGFAISCLVEKETSKKDTMIRELNTHLDLNKTLQKLLLNDFKAAIEVVDENCKIVAWNEKAADLSGIENAVGQLHSTIFAQSIETGQNKLLETITTGKEYMDQEITMFFPDRSPITALVNTYVLRDERYKTVGALAIYRDITHKKQLERQMLQEEKFSALGQMAAGLAHEIRNPLTTVKGFLQLLSPEQLTPKYSEYRDLMLSEVNRTNELISDFVLLSNPSAPIFEQVNLADLTELVFELFHGRAVVNNISLLNQVPDLPLVYLDREQFKHLLLSLYNNSAEAMPDGGIFGVHATVHENNVQIQVWDTGCGIPHDLLQKVFDPFFSTKEDGSGLGLSIGYQIVMNHGGSICVNSRLGSGTTFTITLPLHHPVCPLDAGDHCNFGDRTLQ